MKGKRNEVIVGIFFIQAVASAVLNGDSVVTTVSPYCSAGYVLVGHNCVQCGIGTFRNNTMMSCEYCPVGFYQDVTAQSSCKKCADGKTTVTFGSKSSSDCIVSCDPGQYRSSGNICVDCAVGSYQSESGKDACMQCMYGYTTDGSGKKAPNDCYPICGKGFQFNHTINECNGCKLGYYKDEVGNSINCTACPVNKTTSYENSTSVNNCNIDDCPLGYRRASPTGCQICQKGYYQPMKSQEYCISCGIMRTTETTGATKPIQCINACPDGQQHNFYNDTCTNCDKGFYTDRQKTEKCIKCPNGQTTLFPGANQCIINTISTVAPPASVTVSIKFFFYGRFECSRLLDLENIIIIVRYQIILRLTFLAVKYQGLCSNACQNINSLVITIPIGGCKPKANQGKRRREVAENELQFDVQIPEVSSTLTTANADVTLTSLSVLMEDLAFNLDKYTPLDLQNILSPVNATAYSPKECSNGSVYYYDMCVPCPAGTRYEVSAYDTKTCVTCPLNTYQSLTGQSSCTPCVGVKKYTRAFGSNSSSDCLSECVKTPNYCNTGTCTEDQFSVSCTCPAGLHGDRCQSRDTTDNDRVLIIGMSSGPGVTLIIMIVVLVNVIKFCRSKQAKNLNLNYDVAIQPTTDYENHYLSLDDISSPNVYLHLPTTSSTNTFLRNDTKENNIVCGNESVRTSTHTYLELLVFGEETVHSTQHAYTNTIDTTDHIEKPVDTHDRTQDDTYDYID